MARWCALFMMLLVGTMAFAAPGERSPRDARVGSDASAEKHYHDGLRHRDAAWVYEEKMAGTMDAKTRAGYAQFIQRTYLRALEEFKKATEIDPNFYQAFSSLGYVYRKTGDLEAALVAYGKCLSINPSYSEAIEYRAEAFLELGRVEDAQRAYDVVAPLRPAYAARFLRFAEQWASRLTDAEQRQSFLGWVAVKKEKLGDVKEFVEKW